MKNEKYFLTAKQLAIFTTILAKKVYYGRRKPLPNR